jgi:hypothetical protein
MNLASGWPVSTTPGTDPDCPGGKAGVVEMLGRVREGSGLTSLTLSLVVSALGKVNKVKPDPSWESQYGSHTLYIASGRYAITCRRRLGQRECPECSGVPKDAWNQMN